MKPSAHMWMVTGHGSDPNEFSIEIQAAGEKALSLAKAITGEGTADHFRRVPITEEQAARIVEAEEWGPTWGPRPHFTAGKFSPPPGLNWEIVVQALWVRL